MCEESSTIDSTLFGKYEVKRGLRDLNGQGVLTGLTEISEIRSKMMVDDEMVPCDGKLYYQGIDIEEKKRLSEIMFEKINQNINVAVLLGPGHVEDYTKGIPNCAVIDSNNKQTKDAVVNLMQSRLIRPSYGNDLIGNEIGGAYKNVIGIAAGMLDGLGYCSLKGALMSRSVFEVGKFIEKCGGNPRSASGLAFLGDFEATLFSQHSKNRMFGAMFVKDRNTKKCGQRKE